MKTKSDTEFYSWLAGFIDGEGYLGIVKQKSSHRIHPRLGISNTCKEVLRYIQNRVGGYLRNSRKATRLNHATYILTWRRTKAIELLKKIIPYLTIKKEHARLLISFPVNNSGKNITEIQRGIRERLFLRLKELNQRGPTKEWTFKT